MWVRLVILFTIWLRVSRAPEIYFHVSCRMHVSEDNFEILVLRPLESLEFCFFLFQSISRTLGKAAGSRIWTLTGFLPGSRAVNRRRFGRWILWESLWRSQKNLIEFLVPVWYRYRRTQKVFVWGLLGFLGSGRIRWSWISFSLIFCFRPLSRTRSREGKRRGLRMRSWGVMGVSGLLLPLIEDDESGTWRGGHEGERGDLNRR